MTRNDVERKLIDGTVWDEFCDALKELGPLVLRPELPSDPFNRAIGFRALTQLLRAGLESAVDHADPEFPAFFRLADDTKKMLNDNPDNYYQNCAVDPRFEYRIWGTRGTVQWLSLGSKGSAEAGGMIDTGNLDSRQMQVGSDGRLEIRVSQRRQPGNWLPMTERTRSIVVRQTFGEREKERIAELQIECLDPQRKTNTLRIETLEPALQAAVRFVRSTVDLAFDWQERYKRNHLNRLPEDDQVLCRNAGGDPNIHYYQSYWKLAPDEALLVELDDIPECQTWNLQLSNSAMQSLDFRFFRICVNKHTAHHEPDGSVRIVIAHRDPGPRHPNWLDTCGHDQGGMLGRYVGASRHPREMTTRLVKLADLAT
jgi:uncharacterized protein DUF1214